MRLIHQMEEAIKCYETDGAQSVPLASQYSDGDTDLLLEVIGATINIEDFKEAKTVEDIMFGGLEGRTKRTSFLRV